MRSRILCDKTTSELEEFLFENRYIYPKRLQTFMNCSWRQAYKILKYVKEVYKVETRAVPSEIFRLFLENMWKFIFSSYLVHIQRSQKPVFLKFCVIVPVSKGRTSKW